MIDENFQCYPRFCVWELTLACNMECLHCGSYAGCPRQDEMSTERALKLVDELVELGLERITLSGGEPLMRKDWDQIARRFIEKNVQVGMISNGWFVRENIRKMTSLGKWDIVAMSLDGLRMTHDAFRRKIGSYDRIISSFKALKSAGFKTACITCVSHYNIGELDRIHDLLVSLGVDAWQIQPLFLGGRTRENQDMLLEIKDIIKVSRFIARKRKQQLINVYPADGIGYNSHYCISNRPDGWPGCQAGLMVVGIEANGNIKGCLSLNPEARKDNPFVEGNLKEKSLREIWTDPEAFAYNRRFDPVKAQGFCGSCIHVPRCRCGCTSEAYSSTGTTYDNPYCIYREIMENGDLKPETLVPLDDDFQRRLEDYGEKLQSRRFRGMTGAMGRDPRLI